MKAGQKLKTLWRETVTIVRSLDGGKWLLRFSDRSHGVIDARGKLENGVQALMMEAQP